MKVKTNFGFFSFYSDCDGEGPCNLQGAAGNGISMNNLPSLLVLKQWSVCLAEHKFISLYLNGHVFPFYPLNNVPERVTVCAVLFKYVYSRKQIRRKANKEKTELCRPISLHSKSERQVRQLGLTE